MDKLNSIEKAKFISNEYKEYLKSSFSFKNEEYQKSFNEELEKESLFKGPYLSLNLPFKKGKTINQLISDGVLDDDFKEFTSLNLERKLYLHQEKSIKRINDGRSVIVTTGTGSGKTECFLYPIINGIIKNIKEGHSDQGIRALFLYPMNALVNDQIERIRKILKDYPDIKYAYFTGDTPPKITTSERKAMSDGNPKNPIPDNELLSREEIRNNIPHILFTNYSMLEYLMIRPTDQVIFDSSNLNNWKYIVLDEAHSYTGTKAIELSLLLRRVTGMSNNKQQFILTSATLGEKGKSEAEIIAFAKNLTHTDYSIDDIIFADRIKFDYEIKYQLSNEEIIGMYQDRTNINNVCSSHGINESNDIKANLFELLKYDKTVHELYLILKNKNVTFYETYSKLDHLVSEEALIKLIDLINYSFYDGSSLYDLKYHSFVKALNGIYMTFGKDAKLTLTKTNYIEDNKAHEIGNCRFCNSSFIVGKEVTSPKTGLKYILQNDEQIDIYENYGDSNVCLDYYLIGVDNKDDLKITDNLIECECCSKCGSIYSTENPNALKCSCGASTFKLFKIDNSNKENRSNNIGDCPCCGRSSKSGIVRTLNLGKDEGTALISQILYRSMEKETITKTSSGPKKINLLAKTKKQDEIKDDIKQYLAFSDSRQQASFYAIFLNHNNNRFLQKRLIWEVIKNNNYRNDITLDDLVSQIIKVIKDYRLFDNKLGDTKNAWAAVLVELLKVDGVYGGEGLGLFNFSIDLSDVMNQIEEEDVKTAFGAFNINGVNKAILERLIQISIIKFREAPTIDSTKSTLTPEERQEVLEYRRFDNYMVLKKPEKSSDKSMESFLPVRGTNGLVKYVAKVLMCSIEQAEQALEMIFNNILAELLLKKHPTKNMYQIDASRFILNNYKNTKYYRCKKCGTVTTININSQCINGDCDGELEEIDPDVVFKNNYYRKEYMNRPIERIVVKEHTAQLTREIAKNYQTMFKNKEINILSCSTTFEMGIDIGDLGTVFMRNVPPSPANYVQRAGRAGRSKESTAFILTYCNLGSHDYTYFNDPNSMISGVINPPLFNVQNEKIIIRHLIAASLGFFFRKCPEYFRDVENFVLNNGISEFKKYIETKPKDLNIYINEKVLPEKQYDYLKDFEWFNSSTFMENLDIFEKTVRGLMKDYAEAITKAQTEDNPGDAIYYSGQIKSLKNGRVIDNLSKYSVIPKYGFPVDTVNLQIYDDLGHKDDRYNLTRDLTIAISEYAPDSEVVVDGNKYTSQYVTLPKGNELKKYFYFACESCGRLNISSTQYLGGVECEYCSFKNENVKDDFFVEPSYGFKTGANKESTRMKPVKSYAGEVQYVGNGKADENTININNQILIETSSNDQLVVRNKSNFYVCKTCGFGQVDKTNLGMPYKKISHYNYFKRQCSNEQADLMRLGHVFKTDVAKITCKQIPISADSYEEMISFMYAFLEGMSRELCIDRKDVDGLILKNIRENCWDMMIYDNVPGGAGHVKRLTDKETVRRSLKQALNKVEQKCCDGDTSCYNCLRNYYNQSYHPILTKNKAKSVIVKLLENF